MREAPSPADQVQQLVWSALSSQVVVVLARLGVADALAGGSRDVGDVATAVGCDPAALLRLLRAGATLGLLTEDVGDRYGLTELGESLRSDAPDSARDRVLAFGTPMRWRLMADLEQAVRTGHTTSRDVIGGSIWDHYTEHPDEGAEFSRAMGEVASYTSEVVAAAVDPAERGTILDLGGAHGDLLTGLLQRTPHASGVLFDLPQVIDRARRRTDGSPVSDQLHLVGGDFFEKVPSADIYVLMRILHDWDDAEAHRILATCRRAAPPTARMLIVETLVPDPWAPSPAHLFDLAMLVLQGGRERTESEYRALLAGAGWRLTTVSSTSTAYTLLEAAAD
jgi:O-methyltransferase domain/Dimerisation domain